MQQQSLEDRTSAYNKFYCISEAHSWDLPLRKIPFKKYYCSFNNTPGHLSKLPDEDVQD